MPIDLPPGSPDYAVILANCISSLTDKMDAFIIGLARLDKNQSYLDSKITSLQLAQADRDTCEVRISGIPTDLTSDIASITTAAHTVLNKIECAKAIPFIYKARVFKTKAPPTNNLSMIAIQFSSAVARDDVLSASKKLKGVTSHTLFGTGGSTGVYINPILPPHLHQLDTAARIHAREINYPPPLTRPNAIFMRQTLAGPLIPITSPADLANLTPNTLSQNPSAE